MGYGKSPYQDGHGPFQRNYVRNNIDGSRSYNVNHSYGHRDPRYGDRRVEPFPNDIQSGYLRPQGDSSPGVVQYQKNVRPPLFDGASNWGDFLVQLEMVSQLAGWTSDTMALELAASL